MRILGIITNLAMTTRRQLKDNRMKNLSASLLIAAAAMLFTANARATVVDLTTAGSSGQIGGAFFFQTDQQPAGATNNVITTAVGSGKYDMVMYVPVSDFDLNDKYVVLYFAGQGYGGFEEWTAATRVAPVPEATTFFPIIGLLAAVFSTQFV